MRERNGSSGERLSDFQLEERKGAKTPSRKELAYDLFFASLRRGVFALNQFAGSQS